MPLKLNVGMSRKVGLPDYGSVGASYNVELELESGLIRDDVEGFHARVRSAYLAAHRAVRAELARLNAPVAGAMPGQVRAIRAIARRQGIDPRELLTDYEARSPEELGIRQASELIDRLMAGGDPTE